MPKKTTFVLPDDAARNLDDLRVALQYEHPFTAREASAQNIVTVLLRDATTARVSRLLKTYLAEHEE